MRVETVTWHCGNSCSLRLISQETIHREGTEDAE